MKMKEIGPGKEYIKLELNGEAIAINANTGNLINMNNSCKNWIFSGI